MGSDWGSTVHRLISWFRCWFGYTQLSLSVRTLQHRLEKNHAEKQKSDAFLLKRERAFERLQKWTEQEVERSTGALRSAKEMNQRLEALLETQQMHIKNLEDVVIPGLVAANDTFVKRWQAESMVHVMRSVVTNKGPEVS